MHREENMLGEIRPANWNVSLYRRYFRLSRHYVGSIRMAMLSVSIVAIGITTVLMDSVQRVPQS